MGSEAGLASVRDVRLHDRARQAATRSCGSHPECRGQHISIRSPVADGRLASDKGGAHRRQIALASLQHTCTHSYCSRRLTHTTSAAGCTLESSPPLRGALVVCCARGARTTVLPSTCPVFDSLRAPRRMSSCTGTRTAAPLGSLPSRYGPYAIRIRRFTSSLKCFSSRRISWFCAEGQRERYKKRHAYSHPQSHAPSPHEVSTPPSSWSRHSSLSPVHQLAGTCGA